MKGKYITIILLLSFIFIGEVKADTCYTNYNENWTLNTGFTISSNAGYFITDNINFNKNIEIGNTYDYIKIPLYIVSTSTNNIISNINLYESCTNATNVFDSYTITYQDGSTATIDAENYRTICNQYNTNGTAVLPYQPYITSIKLRLNYNNKATYCDVDNNLMATCRIPKEGNNFIVNSYQVSFSLNGNSSIVKGGIISGYISYCKDGNSQVVEQQQETNTKLDNIDTSINSSNTSGGETAADDLKNNSAFQDNTGLSSIVTAPLSMINSLTSTCSPIRLTIPYIDTTFDIPCIGDLLTSKMGELMQLVKVVINGYICYLIGLDMFKIVKHARDPNDDRIEVLDL